MKKETELDLLDLLFGDEENSLVLKKSNESVLPETMPETLEVTNGQQCPICNHTIRKDYEDYLDYTLCEYRYVCDVCGLTSSYAYGNYETHIEGFSWGYTYNSKLTEEEEALEKVQQQLVMKCFRKLLVEGTPLTEAEETELDNLEREMAIAYGFIEEPQDESGKELVF